MLCVQVGMLVVLKHFCANQILICVKCQHLVSRSCMGVVNWSRQMTKAICRYKWHSRAKTMMIKIIAWLGAYITTLPKLYWTYQWRSLVLANEKCIYNVFLSYNIYCRRYKKITGLRIVLCFLIIECSEIIPTEEKTK